MNDLITSQRGAAEAVANPATQNPLGMFDPAVLDAALKAADHLASSTLVPKDFQRNPGNCLIAIQWGAELGLAPLQAMQNIAVINGRPTLWGDALLAIVQASGALEWISETRDVDGEKESWSATCRLKRRGMEPVEHTFTWDDAKTAGLAGKQGPWQQYPKRMLQMRARGFALRDTFADVLKGVYVAEDAQDLPPEHRGPDGARDVTPEDERQPETAADKVRDKVAAKRKGPDLEDVLAAMNAAEDETALEASAKDVSKFGDADKEKLRVAYRSRLAELRAHEVSGLYTAIVTAVIEAEDVDRAVEAQKANLERLRKLDAQKADHAAEEIAAAREGSVTE